MDIPVIVAECVNPELKQCALDAFANGTPKDRARAVIACMNDAQHAITVTAKDFRIHNMEKWFKYLS